MRCGNPLVRTEKQAGMPAAPAAAPAAIDNAMIWRARYLPPLIMMLIVLGVFVLGIMASNALQSRAQNNETLAVNGHAPAVLPSISKAPASMPPEVKNWLEHLRRIEEQKNKLAAEQVADLKTLMVKYQALGPAAGLLSGTGDDEDNTNPVKPLTDKTVDLSAPWQKLVKAFQSVPPPPECQKLADEYY